jgi:hypothetical protein
VLHSPLKTILWASLLFTFLFFFEYLPPVRQFAIPFDLAGYHYPLDDYAFQSLKHGRFPLWDPTIYCGMSFIANINLALFYPPTWIAFVASLGKDRLSYQAMQELSLAHVWLAFILCYLWLRGKRLMEMPCILGAGVFAFSGYMCTQLQHLGLVAGYAWFPLAFWSIDQAVERESWKPLWKLALASAMCFLAGYPPTWAVLAVSAVAYALGTSWRWMATAGVFASVAASMGIAAVQLLPTQEAQKLMTPEVRYGGGVRDPDYILSYFVPNYYDFGMETPVNAHPGKDLFYLGASAIFGFAFMFRRGNWQRMLPLLLVLAAVLVVATNPYGLVWMVLERSSLLYGLIRDWYFLAGVMPVAAALAAYGLDNFLQRDHRPIPVWLVWSSLVAAAIWACWEVARWLGPGFAAGWKAVFDPLIMLIIFSALLYVYRSQHGTIKTGMAIALVLSVGIDYKVFGTRTRLNTVRGRGPSYSNANFIGMDHLAYQQLHEHSDYRILLDETAPFPEELRHLGLMTPQGTDPFIPSEFHSLVSQYGNFQNTRVFEIDAENYPALHLFGVRYVITSGSRPFYPKLMANPKFRMVESENSYYKVFEYLGATPPFGWESGSAGDRVEVRTRLPEKRQFSVRSAQGGRLTLSEQFFPGWTAAIDGKSAELERWMGAFQAVQVPAGEHIVEFQFRSARLVLGMWISLISLIGLSFWARANYLTDSTS